VNRSGAVAPVPDSFRSQSVSVTFGGIYHFYVQYFHTRRTRGGVNIFMYNIFIQGFRSLGLEEGKKKRYILGGFARIHQAESAKERGFGKRKSLSSKVVGLSRG